MDRMIFYTYSKWIFVLLGIIIGIRILIKNDRIIKYEDAAPSKREFVQIHEKTMNIVAKSIMAVFLTLGSLASIEPALDIPRIVHNDYKITYCRVIKEAHSKAHAAIETIFLIDLDTNEEFYLRVDSRIDHVGKVFTIKYLPHTKIGAIIEQETDSKHK